MGLRFSTLPLWFVVSCTHATSQTGVLAETTDLDGGSSEVTALARKVETAAEEVRAQAAALDEAIWRQWTRGTSLVPGGEPDGRGSVFSPQTLATLRRARELAASPPRATGHLERHVAGVLLARAVAEEGTILANLEASATFSLDGKEQAWRDLGRLLVHEPSAVKRRALWTASLAAAERLDAAVAQRDAKAQKAIAALGYGSTLEFAAATRELDLDELARTATAVLSATDALWQGALRRLADDELKLPANKLSRADLPRLFKVPAAVDAAFPKAQVGARGVTLLGALGLYGRPGLTLELSEGATKSPLPLTVAPGGAADVRVSFRPAGGLRDQASLLSELGLALALHHVKEARFEYLRLGDPACAQVGAELFSNLLGELPFLETLGVSPEVRERVADFARAQQLLVVRREAGTVKATLETRGLDEREARTRFVAVMNEALGVRHSEVDGIRWRLDTDELLRSATGLRAMLLAAKLGVELQTRAGPDWWKSPIARAHLALLWAPGTSVSIESRLGPMREAIPALLKTLGGALAGEPEASPEPEPVRAASSARSSSP